MFELTYELLTVAASNPHLIFLLCNLIIVILILVSLEPTSNSDDHKHTPTPIPSPPPLVTNETKSFETTPRNRITLLEETTTNVIIDVDKVSCDSDLSVDKDCNLSVDKVSYDSNLSVDKVSYDCNLEDKEELEDDDELRRRVEEFIDKINSGWKAEKLSLRYNHQLNSSNPSALPSYGSKSGSRPRR